MNPDEYIQNGTVIDYCLGILKENERLEFEIALELYPQLKEEVSLIRKDMDVHLKNRYQPNPELKEKIWSTLQNLALEKDMNISALPLINKYSDHSKWLETVRPLLPAQAGSERFVHVLTHSDTVTQVLIRSSTDIEDEVHDNVMESFIILEGECECHIGDQVVRVQAGGYLEIPLHEHHDVRILSDYVIGVMQRVAV